MRRGAREVVRNVSLQLRAGELVALLGPNGAGKSTLLDALSGALAPAAGTIERRGRVAVALQAPDRARRSLDAESRARLLEDSVCALRSDARATLVVVHDRTEAWALADRLLILIGGELVAAGAPRELLASPPSALVARFLGFDGWLADAGETLLTRPAHVTLDPAGPLRARVTRAVALEDGFRLELELEDGRGRLYAVAPLPAPRPGEHVRVRVDGGARFATADAPR